jgi:hypothetical protein
MAKDVFTPKSGLFPDYALPQNWSGGKIPVTGAVISGSSAMLNPQTTLNLGITLEAGGALSANGGGFTLGPFSTLHAVHNAALYGAGVILNRGAITAGGAETHLRIVVGNASPAIPAAYGLAVPSFENSGSITAKNGGTIAVDGTEFSNQGHVVLNGGTLLVSGGAVDGGQGAAPPGGTITISHHGAAIFSDGVADQTFVFSGKGQLRFDDVVDVSNVTISGFDAGSRIYAPSEKAAAELLQHLTFTGLPDHYAPTILHGAHGGGVIELEPAVPCFARGCRILTPLGYVAVEHIKPGDPVVTAAGATRPVRWAGRRTIDFSGHSRPDAARPVSIIPGAFGPGVPARTVRLSPDHALLLRGVLVPVKLLTNGATILRETDCQAVTYHHLELDRHEILLAEGLAVESYIDTGNRAMFEAASGTPRASPVFGRGAQWDSAAYAPLCLAGPALRAIREALLARVAELGFTPRTLTGVSLSTGGRIYYPVRGTVATPGFRLAVPHPETVTIHSERFVPAEFSAGNGEDDDYRTLGIAIRQISIGRARFAPRDIAVSGFHPRGEGDVSDWTDGNGVIAVPPEQESVRLAVAALPQGWVKGEG